MNLVISTKLTFIMSELCLDEVGGKKPAWRVLSKLEPVTDKGLITNDFINLKGKAISMLNYNNKKLIW